MSPTPLQQSRDQFIRGMTRISSFWGFPKAMGAVYGAVYLSPDPVSLDELVERVSVTKGAVSTNVRQLERLGMVHRIVRIGERKDYYTAETDFWKVIRGILRARENSEFDRALRSVDGSLELIGPRAARGLSAEEARLAGFYRERMSGMQAFFRSLDQLVAVVLAFDNLKSATIGKLLGHGTPSRSKEQ